MNLLTTRFGVLTVSPQDEILFAKEILGLENCRRWVLLADSENPLLGWLQSIDLGHVALGIVSPRRFVREYQLRVSSSELASLELATLRDAAVVVIASRYETGFTLNLRAPLVINVERGLGCQVIAHDEYPVQYPLDLQNTKIRLSA